MAAWNLITLSLCLVGSVIHFLAIGIPVPDQTKTASMFRAGAYEERSVSSFNATTRQAALTVMKANLAQMEEKAKVASKEGVNVMVFAEYGITGDMGGERSAIYPYMEEIPATSKTHPACTSCDDIVPGREGQTTIGCFASKYKMYIVANLIENVPCDSDLDSLCPSDGHYQYNTNIVYDPKGCLIAKYHKYHRYEIEFAIIDKPAQPECVYFDTEYGRFGTIICADLLYEHPAITLAEQYKIDHMLFPTNWDGNGLPYASAVEWQLAYATLANVNFVGAGIHVGSSFGSSILSGQKVVNFTSNYKTDLGTLITGDLPTHKPTLGTQARLQIAGSAAYPYTSPESATALIFGDMYNVVVLTKLKGNAQVCQKSICCSLDYTRNKMDETYVLGAFSGIHTMLEKLAVEICLVYKCGNNSLSSCSNVEVVSATAFSQFKLTGNFSIKYVYPTLLPSGFEYQQLNWTFQRSVADFKDTIVSSSRWPLVAAALAGRDFKHDPQV